MAVILLVTVGTSRAASAFCRTTTCEIAPLPADCNGTFDANSCSNEGAPLVWGSRCLSYSVHRAGSTLRGITSDDLERSVRTAFDAWAAAVCRDGNSPTFYFATYPQVTCEQIGYREQGPNQNLWIFQDERWEHEVAADGTLALTTLSVVPATGEIFDADVELNARDFDYTTGDTAAGTDLDSVVLHESGHVLGIGHSSWSTSVMAPEYQHGSIDARSLKQDDIDAICAVMPPGELPSHCDPEPRHGFSTECDFTDRGCSCDLSHPRSTQSPLGCLVFIASVLGYSRRRRPLFGDGGVDASGACDIVSSIQTSSRRNPKAAPGR